MDDDIRPEDLEAAHKELQPSPLEGSPPPPPAPPPPEEEVWIASEPPGGYADSLPEFADEDPGALSTSEASLRNAAMVTHLAAFAGMVIPFGNIIGPLIAWQVGKDKGAYVDQQGKESMNFQITWTIYLVVAFLSLIVLVGLLLIPAVALSWFVLTILGTIKAANGEPWRYPLTWRLIN